MNIRESLKRLKRFLTVVISNVVNDQVFVRATGLAFTTMLTIVPVIMVIFSFGGFNQLSLRILDGIGDFLLPDGDDAIMRGIQQFTENAGRLNAWASVLFLASATMLLNAVESHLNSIFRARPHRGAISRFGMYVASLLLISFIFGSGFGPISGIIAAWEQFPLASHKILGNILSIIGSTLGMTILFTLLSAAKIKVRNALIGSFFGALAFQAAKQGFAFWTANSVRQSIIYGSVVFIPKLLIWLDLAWIIFLVSAEITWAAQRGAGRIKPLRQGSPADETELGWRLFLEIADNFSVGKDPPNVRDLAATLSTNEAQLSGILQRLEDDGLVRTVAGHPPGYLPASDLGRIKGHDVLGSVAGWSSNNDAGEPGDASVYILKGIRTALAERDIRSFLEEKNSIDPVAELPADQADSTEK